MTAHFGKGWFSMLLLGVTTFLVMMMVCEPSSAGEPVFKGTGMALETGSQGVDPSTPMTYTLSLLHSNDTWGYVDPCG